MRNGGGWVGMVWEGRERRCTGTRENVFVHMDGEEREMLPCVLGRRRVEGRKGMCEDNEK